MGQLGPRPERTIGQTPFQEWLQSHLDELGWNQARLAKELGAGRSTVGRWLFPPDHAEHRRPSMAHLRNLSELFGVDPVWLASLIGLEWLDKEERLTPIRRHIVQLVTLIPDDVLWPVYLQLRALVDPAELPDELKNLEDGRPPRIPQAPADDHRASS